MSDNIIMVSMVLDKIFLALCGLALLIRLLLQPSLHNFGAWGQENIATLVSNLTLFIIVFLFILKKTALRENIRFPMVLGPFVLFCLLANLSIYSIDAPSSLLHIFDLWASFFFVLVLVNLLNSVIFIEIIVGIMIMLMVIVAGDAVYEHLVILPKILTNALPGADRGNLQLFYSHRTATLFGWPNLLAGFLVMTLPLTMAYHAHRRRLAIQILMGIITLLSLYALFIALTISSWIGLLAGGTIFFLILKKRAFTPHEKMGAIFILLFIGLILIFTFYRKLSLPGVSSVVARQQYLLSCCYLIKLHPFLGSGWKSYGIASAAYIKDSNERSFYAHNTYLQIWTELGIIGLIVFLSFLWRLWKDALVLFHERYRRFHWLAGAMIAGIVGCIADNFFSFTILKPQVSLFWWVQCALVICLKENLAPSACVLKSQNTWKKLILMVTLAGMVILVFFTWAEYDYSIAVNNISQGGQYEKADILCREAKKLNPWDKKFDLVRAYALNNLFTQNFDIRTLQQAYDAALRTEGQTSLGFEREWIIKKIRNNLTVFKELQRQALQKRLAAQRQHDHENTEDKP